MAKPPSKRYGNWVKNFGKSIAFSSKTVLAETTPHLSDTLEKAKSDVNDLRNSLRSLRRDKKAILGYLLGDEDHLSEYASLALKNAKESLKTGKFIDEKRSDKLLGKAFGFDESEFDFDDDSSFDMNFGDDDPLENDSFSSVQMGPSKIVNLTGPSSAAMNRMASSISSNNATIANGFSALGKSSKQTFAISLAMSEKNAGITHEKLGNITDNLTAMVSFNNETMSPFVQGSLKYYEDSLNVLTDIRTSLQNISGVEDTRERKAFDDNGYSDIFGSGFSIKGYGERVAKNARTAFQDSAIGSVLQMINQPMFLAEIAANPFGLLLGEGIKSTLPRSLTRSLERTDKNFKEFLPALFNKIGSYSDSDNPLLSALGSIFGIKQSKGYDSFNRGEYQKGPIPFDGQTKKAITEVIPSYLSKISYTIETIAKAVKVEGYQNLTPQQIMYDWGNDSGTGGRFVTIDYKQKAEKERVRDIKLSGFWDAQNDFDRAASAYFGWGSNKRDTFTENFKNMLEYMVDNDKTFNKNDKSNALLKKFFKDEDISHARRIISSLDADSLLSMAGSGIFEGRNALARHYNDKVRNAITNNDSVIKNRIFNPIAVKPRIIEEEYYNNDKSLGITRKKGSKESDPIKQKWQISKEGIKAYNKRYNTHFTNVSAIIEHYNKHVMSASSKENSIADMEANAVKDIESIIDTEYKTYLDKHERSRSISPVMTREEFSAANYDRIKDERVGDQIRAKKDYISDSDGSVAKYLGDIFSSPLKFVEGSLRKIDNLMYRIIFDSDDESIFAVAVQSIRNAFDKTVNFFKDDVIKPFKAAIFGLNVKDSEWYKTAKDFLSLKVFGEKDEKTGEYKDGVLSGAINGTKEFFKETSKQYTEWFKPKMMDTFDTMRQYIFGEDSEEDKNKPKVPLMDRMMNMISTGFNQWSAIFLGHDPEDADKAAKDGAKARESFKLAMPKMFQGIVGGAALGTVSGLGGFGVLGSLFLPGGPIGGAIVGGALGLLNQSESFSKFMYGDKDEKTGDLSGGVLSSALNFFNKHKVPMLGGAGFGVLSSIFTGGGVGLIPGMVVGLTGPVVAGSVWGLAMKSQAMQEALFGKEEVGEDGVTRKVGGLFNSQMKEYLKKAAPRALTGALSFAAGSAVLGELGIVGSALALGPIPSAIAGAALGLATASKSFTHHFFGYTDDKGEYHSGTLDRMKNRLMANVFQPVEQYLSEQFFKSKMWFKKNIAYPIADAVFPIKLLTKKVGRTIFDNLSKTFSSITKNTGELFNKIESGIGTIFNTILKPLSLAGRGLFQGLSFAIRGGMKAMTLPLELMGAYAESSIYGSAKRKARDNATSALRSAWSVGTLGDMKSALGQLGEYAFTDNWKDQDEYASQLNEYEKSKADRLLRYNDEKTSEEKRLADRRKKLEQFRKDVKKNGYNLTPEQISARVKEITAGDTKAVIENLGVSGDKQDIIANEELRLQSETLQEVKSIKEQTVPDIVARAITGAQIEANDVRSVDDNATKAAELRKAEEEREKSKELQEKMAEGIDSLNEALTGQDPNKKKKSSGFFSKAWDNIKGVAGNIGGIFGGIFGLVGQVTKLVGIAGGIATLVGFLGSGDNRKGGYRDKIISNQATGNIMERVVRGGVRAVAGLGGLVNRSIIQSSFGQKAIATAKDWAPSLLKMANTGIDKLDNVVGGGGLGKIAQSALSAVKEYMTKHGKVFGPNLPVAMEFFQNLIKWGCDSKVIGTILKQGGKLAGRLTAAIAKTAVGTASAFTITGAFALYDGITGFSDASRLFDVHPQDVDFKMRLVSSFVNTVFGLPYMNVIDVGLSAASLGIVAVNNSSFMQSLAKLGLSFEGFDHRKIIAKLIYSWVADSEEVNNLNANQNKLRNEYEAYLKQNNLDSSKMSFDEYQSKVKDNETMWDAYGAPIVKSIFGIDPGKGNSLGDLIMKPVHRFADWFTNAVNKVLEMDVLGFFGEMLGFKKNAQGETTFSPQWLTDLNNRAASTMGYDYSEFAGDGDGINKHATSISKKMRNMLASVGFSGDFAGAGMEPTRGSTTAVRDNLPKVNFYYSQDDKRYRDRPLLSFDKNFGSIRDLGCAPTALAMLATKYSGKHIDPLETASAITSKDVRGDGPVSRFVLDKGIKSSYFGRAASQFGLNMVPIDKENVTPDQALNLLRDGASVILGGKSSAADMPFTSAGHYVVVSGIEDGTNNVYVYDPLDRSSGRYDGTKLFGEVFKNDGFAAAFNSINDDPPMVIQQREAEIAKNRIKQNAQNVRGTAIVKRARDYVKAHTPYDLNKFGGKPGVATSCAKLCTDVYLDCGINIANNTTYVKDIYKYFEGLGGIMASDTTEIEPGDIVIWNSPKEDANGQGGWCAHCGILTGNGKGVIHASSGRKRVVEDSDYTKMGDLTVNCICKARTIPQMANNVKGENVKKDSFLGALGKMGKALFDVVAASLRGEFWNPSDSDLPYTMDGLSTSHGGRTISKKEVYKILKNQGYNDTAIAGIMGNIMQESSFNSKDTPLFKYKDLEHGGIGLFQWAYPSRQEALKKYAKDNGLDYTDPLTQLAFFEYERNNYSEFAGVKPSSFNKLATDPATAAYEFNRIYEKGTESSKRGEYAIEFASSIANGEFSGAGISKYTDRYARMNKFNARLNNEHSVQNVPVHRILPSSVGDGIDMYDVIRSIRSTDIHAEMVALINETRTTNAILMAKMKDSSREPNLDKNKINSIMRDIKNSQSQKGISPQRVKGVLDFDKSLKDHAVSSYEMAYNLARGGNFRK